MDLSSIKTILLSGAGGLFILLTLIQISPIKINPWGWIAKKIGAALNAEQTEKIERLVAQLKEQDEKISALNEKIDENEAKHARIRILEFSDRLLKKQKFSQENFQNILKAIDFYEAYCDKHENFKNNVAVSAIKVIKKTYEYCLEHHCFLTEASND